LDRLPDDSLQPEFQKRAIMDFEQLIGDVNSEIRVDSDQVGIRRQDEFWLVQSVPDDRLPKLLVGVNDDVSGIQQSRLGQMRDRAASPVST
jgi:hypothetical protein